MRRRHALWALSLMLGIGLVSGCGQVDDRTSASRPLTEGVSSGDVHTAESLRAASHAITTAADENHWSLSAVVLRPDMSGLIVEVLGENAQPSLEASIQALVEVPVSFRYGGGEAIIRPAQVTPKGRSRP